MGAAIYFRYGSDTFDGMPTPGSRIKERRRALDLTQGDVAKATGLDQSTISDIEKGSNFSIEKLLPISRALSISPQFILEGPRGVDPKLAELLGAWEVIGPEDRRALLSAASAYVLRAQQETKATRRKRANGES